MPDFVGGRRIRARVHRLHQVRAGGVGSADEPADILPIVITKSESGVICVEQFIDPPSVESAADFRCGVDVLGAVRGVEHRPAGPGGVIVQKLKDIEEQVAIGELVLIQGPGRCPMGLAALSLHSLRRASPPWRSRLHLGGIERRGFS